MHQTPTTGLGLVTSAVSYVRVSTTGQAERARAREGFSIPAQREANKRHAHSLGALLVAEFIERGASARSAARPELQRMLTYIAEHHIDYVIVHKLDRLARNRADDVLFTEQIRAAGARLVSTTEAISDSPDGRLLHGIMASIAEFYSHNLSLEVTKGMRQKVTQGGTAGRAPLGYRNIRIRDHHGREDATVELDPDRAEHITWAFTAYAQGDTSLTQLPAALTQRGLTTRPMAGRDATALTARSVRKILTNPYYQGIVRFGDLEQPGEHPPLVDPVTWATVQDMLKARRNGTRSRVHDHYLKGTIRCHACGRQLIVHRARSKSGTIYEYFICSARRGTTEPCTQRAIQIPHAVQRVEELWRSFPITETIRDRVLDIATAESRREIEHLQSQVDSAVADLEDEQQKLYRLADLIDDGAVPLDLAPGLQQQSEQQAAEISERLHRLERLRAEATQALRDTVATCQTDTAAAYLRADPPLRQQLNQTVFASIRIGREPDQIDHDLA